MDLQSTQSVKQILTDIFSDAFEKCGYDKSCGTVAVSNRPDLCQYQCNGAMSAAKQHKKAPIAIANEVLQAVGENDKFSMITAVAPGFININISDEFLSQVVSQMNADSRLNLPFTEQRTIVVDYGGANIAKPLHVGHLRSAIMGDFMCRLAKFLGNNVIGDIHLGDWGLQMGLVIAEIQLAKPDLPYFNPDFAGKYPSESPVTADELNVIYPQASKRSKEDEAFAKTAADVTVRLQNKEKGIYDLWQRIHEISIADLKENYDKLGVSFDKWLGESDADPYIPRVIEALQNKGLLKESDGAMVVDVSREDDKEPMPPIIVVKSNGGDMYGTTDMGTILQRVEDWNPDEFWYVVDNRQALHFKQVFRCAEKAGFITEKQCTHISFGTMNGKDGKPYKTRDGGVMRLSDMIGDVTQSAYEKISESNADMPQEQKLQTAREVGVAALKIGDFINHRVKDYIFDMEKFLAKEGKTGPYLLYTCARINSILKNAGASADYAGKILPALNDVERELMLSLIKVPESLLRTFNDKTPNVICETLFEISAAFNRFYHENNILKCEDKARKDSWLALITLTQKMLKTLLDLMGIKVPERM